MTKKKSSRHKEHEKAAEPATKARTLLCIRECESPGIGAWKPGDKIEDEKLVEAFRNNTLYFRIEEESK